MKRLRKALDSISKLHSMPTLQVASSQRRPIPTIATIATIAKYRPSEKKKNTTDWYGTVAPATSVVGQYKMHTGTMHNTTMQHMMHIFSIPGVLSFILLIMIGDKSIPTMPPGTAITPVYKIVYLSRQQLPNLDLNFA